MSTISKYLLSLWLLLIVLTSNAYSDVISGIGVLDKGAWDFSDTTSVHPLDESADITFARTALTEETTLPLTLYVCANPPAQIAVITYSTFEELQYAPPDTSSLYGYYACAFESWTYVIKTREGNYGKFRLLHLGGPYKIIEYVYQPDGSRKLFGDISVEKSSWGAIKSIFRMNTSRE